ncbi:hypothetical protein CDAR_515671 [Caerostris darwini]|uniref:Uncharacterized protein n=1 Tax=Caerostris darwini TaxID=1538125 RepID=A0AAV4S3E0_9ARAC|nr:hypothetical protein CDAR_515671 [Caerostris darwini]
MAPAGLEPEACGTERQRTRSHNYFPFYNLFGHGEPKFCDLYINKKFQQALSDAHHCPTPPNYSRLDLLRHRHKSQDSGYDKNRESIPMVLRQLLKQKCVKVSFVMKHPSSEKESEQITFENFVAEGRGASGILMEGVISLQECSARLIILKNSARKLLTENVAAL